MLLVGVGGVVWGESFAFFVFWLCGGRFLFWLIIAGVEGGETDIVVGGFYFIWAVERRG